MLLYKKLLLMTFGTTYVFFLFLNVFYTYTQLNNAVTHTIFNYVFQKLSLLHWQGYKCE